VEDHFHHAHDQPVTALLSVDGLTARRNRRTILDDVTFAVSAGEIVGVIGPNGAGKTTLFECIAGLQPFDAGTIKPSPTKPLLFYVPDGIRPWPDQRAQWVLRTTCDAFRTPPPPLLGLDAVIGQRVSSLSKGEAKRLAIAIGLATPQPILFLDEPFDGLDLRQALSVMETLRETAKKGRTLVLAIHQLNDAVRLCDRLLLLNNGRLAASGTLGDLRQRAGTPQAGIEEIFLALT
jgi:ABC-2 type transport system ATP-binding protein